MTFDKFKASEPARSMCRRLGIDQLLKAAESWSDFRALVVRHNDPDIGRVVDAGRRAYGTCSSGERILVKAILYVTDFAWLADELDADEGDKRGRTWRRMDSASGEFRECVAACIGARI
jgi:hypothetical protein